MDPQRNLPRLPLDDSAATEDGSGGDLLTRVQTSLPTTIQNMRKGRYSNNSEHV